MAEKSYSKTSTQPLPLSFLHSNTLPARGPAVDMQVMRTPTVGTNVGSRCHRWRGQAGWCEGRPPLIGHCGRHVQYHGFSRQRFVACALADWPSKGRLGGRGAGCSDSGTAKAAGSPDGCNAGTGADIVGGGAPPADIRCRCRAAARFAATRCCCSAVKAEEAAGPEAGAAVPVAAVAVAAVPVAAVAAAGLEAAARGPEAATGLEALAAGGSEAATGPEVGTEGPEAATGPEAAELRAAAHPLLLRPPAGGGGCCGGGGGGGGVIGFCHPCSPFEVKARKCSSTALVPHKPASVSSHSSSQLQRHKHSGGFPPSKLVLVMLCSRGRSRSQRTRTWCPQT